MFNLQLNRWSRTSRNTEIRLQNDNTLGLVLLKKTDNLSQQQLNAQLTSFELLHDISTLMPANIITPKAHRHLSNENTIVLEFLNGPTFHQVWKGRQKNIKLNIHEIQLMLNILEKFHISSAEYNQALPFAFRDFGPKNLIKLPDDVFGIIDPPLQFEACRVTVDIGVLLFEVERSCLQTKNFQTFFNVQDTVDLWIEKHSTRSVYKHYHSDYLRHIIDVFSRYAKFYKKRYPLKQLVRGIFSICVIIFALVAKYLYLVTRKIFDR